MGMKIGARERMAIESIFKEDLEAINMKINEQLVEFYGETRQDVLQDLGIDEATDEAQSLEREIKAKQMELTRLRERLTREIHMAEQRLLVLRDECLGQYRGPPEPEQLLELGFTHDSPIENRKWYGFPVATKLDAMVCIAMKKRADVHTPLTAVSKIARSVQRELTFAATYEDAEAVYKKFYGLNFRQYGVDIPPRLDDLKKLKGQRLLKMDVTERNPPKQLTDKK